MVEASALLRHKAANTIQFETSELTDDSDCLFQRVG
jgi:hypothetical protein